MILLKMMLRILRAVLTHAPFMTFLNGQTDLHWYDLSLVIIKTRGKVRIVMMLIDVFVLVIYFLS